VKNKMTANNDSEPTGSNKLSEFRESDARNKLDLYCSKAEAFAETYSENGLEELIRRAGVFAFSIPVDFELQDNGSKLHAFSNHFGRQIQYSWMMDKAEVGINTRLSSYYMYVKTDPGAMAMSRRAFKDLVYSVGIYGIGPIGSQIFRLEQPNFLTTATTTVGILYYLGRAAKAALSPNDTRYLNIRQLELNFQSNNEVRIVNDRLRRFPELVVRGYTQILRDKHNSPAQ
jgi:hypothetical protein